MNTARGRDRNKLAIMLLALGLLLGPGYYVYARFFSGDLVDEQTYIVTAGSVVPHFEPVHLTLTPDMRPIGLVLRFSLSHGPTIRPPDTPRNDYHAQLLDGERVVMEQRFSLQSSLTESTPSVQFQRALPPLSIDRAADYRLALSVEGEPQMQVHSADVQVRAHVRQPEPGWVAAGVFLALAGFLLLVL